MIVSGRNRHFKGFDDPVLQHQHSLQNALQQSVPLTLDGGREVLYWCRSCRTSWYSCGRCVIQTHLSHTRLSEFAHRLQVDVTIPAMLPHALCPCCASRFFGGIPRIEAYMQDRGYRLSWERVKSPAMFLCCLYTSPFSSGRKTIQEVLSCSTDVPLPSIRIEQMLQWLIELPDPDWSQHQSLSSEHSELLTRFREPTRALAWQGYTWKTFCPPLGG